MRMVTAIVSITHRITACELSHSVTNDPLASVAKGSLVSVDLTENMLGVAARTFAN